MLFYLGVSHIPGSWNLYLYTYNYALYTIVIIFPFFHVITL